MGAPERVIIPIEKVNMKKKLANAVMTKYSSAETFKLLKDTPTMQHRLECFQERPIIISLKESPVFFRPSLHRVFGNEILQIVGEPETGINKQASTLIKIKPAEK